MTDVFVSSSALQAQTVTGAAAELRRHGLGALELTSSMPAYGAMADEAVSLCGEGFRVQVHNYFPPPVEPFVLNLASADRTIRQRSIDHCRAALELSARVGAASYSVHAGFVADPVPSELGGAFRGRPVRSRDEAQDVFHDTVGSLCDTAASLGVMLLIENNVLAPANLLASGNGLLLGVTPADFEDLFRSVPRANLGMLLDVGHLKVSATSLGLNAGGMLDGFRPFVKALHLSDNDGLSDSNQGFDETAWFLPHLAKFPGLPRVIETRPLGDGLSRCVGLVEGVA